MSKPTFPKTLWSGKDGRKYNPKYKHTDVFYSDVKMNKKIQLIDHGPENVYRLLYTKALEYVDTKINAVDVGCRDGEFSRYLTWTFDHVYCFDYRKRINFAMNLDVSCNKITHYTCALGDSIKFEYASGRGNFRSTTVDARWQNKEKRKIFPLDHFDFTDVNLIKVDVDGMDGEVIKGATETIKKYKPVIIIEELTENGVPNHNGLNLLRKLGYKEAYVHKSSGIHRDYVMVQG